MHRLAIVLVIGCGSTPATSVDAPPAPTGDSAPDSIAIDAPSASDPFWADCGTEAADFTFVDSGVPFAVGRDGTMYAARRSSLGGTVIGRKRPGQPAEMDWVTVAAHQLDAVENMAGGPAGVLYFLGWVNNVQGLYRVADTGTITAVGDPLPTGSFFNLIAYNNAPYIADDQSSQIFRVDPITGARTVAVTFGTAGVLHFTFGSTTTVYITSYNAPLTKVTLDAGGAEVARETVTAFGSDPVYKVGIDQKGRIYGMTFPNNAEVLERFDPATSQRTTVFGGNLRWSDWTWGRGALKCDLLITSRNSSITAVRPGDQTPAWP